MYCLSVFESGLLCNVNNKRTIADKDAAAKRGELYCSDSLAIIDLTCHRIHLNSISNIGRRVAEIQPDI